MWPWWLPLLVTVYVAIDVANPMMPGALVFSPGESIEASQSPRCRANDEATAVAPAPERLGPIAPVLVPPRPVSVAPRAPRTHVTRAHLPLRAPSPAAEDDAAFRLSR